MKALQNELKRFKNDGGPLLVVYAPFRGAVLPFKGSVDFAGDDVDDNDGAA